MRVRTDDINYALPDHRLAPRKAYLGHAALDEQCRKTDHLVVREDVLWR